MKRRRVTIRIDPGLRARFAEDFVNTARRSPQPVSIGRADGGRQIDAKRILLVMELDLDAGEEVEIMGENDEVLDELVAQLAVDTSR